MAVASSLREKLSETYRFVRQTTEKLCEPLEPDDYFVQAMPDASPVKWHLAHTTWFFETFILEPNATNYRPYNPQFRMLFNSYYNSVGARWSRPERGLLVRPTVAEVLRYRDYVDECMAQLLETGDDRLILSAEANILLGLNHEQQHQELILTDLKYAWSLNPLRPQYRPRIPERTAPPPLRWIPFTGGLHYLGHDGQGFAFDNESPRHRVLVHDFELASRLVTNGEYREFIEDGGYDRPELWLSDGWTTREAQGWSAPLYWARQGDEWSVLALSGPQPLQSQEPVCHVSFYEADAFARWADARLVTEAEWETAATNVPLAGHFLEAERFHPSSGCAARDVGPIHQLFGDVWQWTASPYGPYPGFRAAAGALGEYNGKFMCNQFVLRGASCATPRSHARPTYRNFFPPQARWQFTGIRLAKEPS
jgi:ergothioneine biosynthesis protein EgtB